MMNHFLFTETLELLMRGAIGTAYDLFSQEQKTVADKRYILLLEEKHPIISGTLPESDFDSETGATTYSFPIYVEWLPLPNSDDRATVNTSVVVRTFADVETQQAGLVILSDSDGEDYEYHDALGDEGKHVTVYEGYGILNESWQREFINTLRRHVFLISPASHMQDFGSEEDEAEDVNSDDDDDTASNKPRKLSAREKENMMGVKVLKYQEAWLEAFENRPKYEQD